MLWTSAATASSRPPVGTAAARATRSMPRGAPAHGSGYVLRVESEELDLERFERLVDQAHQVMAAGDLELATGS